MVLTGAGKDDERLSGGVGLDEYGVGFSRKGAKILVLEPLGLA